MTLPVIQTPEFELELPSNGKVVKYRPFLVKEEKIFLMAVDSEDSNEMIKALSQIINQCTFGEVDASKLSNFDLEYIFLQLRCKSVGSKVQLSINGDNGQEIPIEIDLEDVQITGGNDSNVVMITDTVGFEMSYPVFAQMEKYATITDEYELGLMIIKDCIKNVIDGETVIDFSKVDDEEKQNMLDNLGKPQYEKLLEFFKNMPKLQLVVKYMDGDEKREIVLEGLKDFFS